MALKHEVQEIRRVRGEMESLADTVAAHLARYHMVTLCDTSRHWCCRCGEVARRLKQDIMEKTRALDIDRDCAQLGELSVRIHNHPGNQVVSTVHSEGIWGFIKT